MRCIRHPKAGEPFSLGVINVLQKGQHHSTEVTVQKQKRVADISVVNSMLVEVFKHFHEKGGCDTGFYRRFKNHSMVFP